MAMSTLSIMGGDDVKQKRKKSSGIFPHLQRKPFLRVLLLINNLKKGKCRICGR